MRYSYSLEYANGVTAFCIRDCKDNEYSVFDAPIVWSRPRHPDDENSGEYFLPADVRAKYEELNGKPEFDSNFTPEKFMAGQIGVEPNLVELMDDEQAWDQPCLYGNRCGGHAVYCHNDGWLYSPRKCRRTWYSGGKTRDEDCPGFSPNPNFKPVTE